MAEQRKREAALYLSQSESRSLAAEAKRRTDETLPYSVGLNTLLALDAARRNATPEAIDAVRETARLLPLSVKRFDHQAQPVAVVLISPDGQRLATVAYGKLAALLALGFFVGGYFGGSLAQLATGLQLRRIFAVCLAGIAVKMFLQK